MLRTILCLAAFTIVAAACSKDKFQTKPTISIKSINGTEFPTESDILITLEYTDKEGDLANGQLTYFRNRLNVLYPPTNDLADTAYYQIPDFPKTTQGEFQLRIQAGFLNENPQQNDTVSFKIFVVDRAGNVSDTIATPALVQIQP